MNPVNFERNQVQHSPAAIPPLQFSIIGLLGLMIPVSFLALHLPSLLQEHEVERRQFSPKEVDEIDSRSRPVLIYFKPRWLLNEEGPDFLHSTRFSEIAHDHDVLCYTMTDEHQTVEEVERAFGESFKKSGPFFLYLSEDANTKPVYIFQSKGFRKKVLDAITND